MSWDITPSGVFKTKDFQIGRSGVVYSPAFALGGVGA
jgi:hypothetical protein